MFSFSLETNDFFAKAYRYPKRKPIANDRQFEILLHISILLVKLKYFITHFQTVVLDRKFWSRGDKKETFVESLQLNEVRLLFC